MRHYLLISILIVLLAAQVTSAATFTGAVSHSMGGTGRGAVIPSEVSLLNPASFVSVRGYNIATAYRDFSYTSGVSERNFLVNLGENSTGSMFPLSVTYLRTSTHQLETEDIHLTTGQAIGGNIAFGLDVARYKVLPDNGPDDSEWDIKFGFLYAPKDTLGVGLVFSSLLNTDNPALKRQIEAGVNYLFADFFRAALDVVYQIEDNPKDEGIIMVGFEHIFKGNVPFRAGFKWDDPNNQNHWTLGLGWNGPRIGFDYSYEKNASKTNEYGHSVDLRIYF